MSDIILIYQSQTWKLTEVSEQVDAYMKSARYIFEPSDAEALDGVTIDVGSKLPIEKDITNVVSIKRYRNLKIKSDVLDVLTMPDESLDIYQKQTAGHRLLIDNADKLVEAMVKE